MTRKTAFVVLAIAVGFPGGTWGFSKIELTPEQKAKVDQNKNGGSKDETPSNKGGAGATPGMASMEQCRCPGGFRPNPKVCGARAGSKNQEVSEKKVSVVDSEIEAQRNQTVGSESSGVGRPVPRTQDDDRPVREQRDGDRPVPRTPGGGDRQVQDQLNIKVREDQAKGDRQVTPDRGREVPVRENQSDPDVVLGENVNMDLSKGKAVDRSSGGGRQRKARAETKGVREAPLIAGRSSQSYQVSRIDQGSGGSEAPCLPIQRGEESRGQKGRVADSFGRGQIRGLGASDSPVAEEPNTPAGACMKCYNSCCASGGGRGVCLGQCSMCSQFKDQVPLGSCH